jgi:hypothetical protein
MRADDPVPRTYNVWCAGASGKMLSEERRYYVYGYFDAAGVPFYVGKGTERRGERHALPSVYMKGIGYLYRRMRQMVRDGENWTYQVIEDGLDEKAALDLETDLILKWGRVALDNGPLLNTMCLGGRACDGFLMTMRPIGRIDLHAGELLKRYDFEDDGGLGREPRFALIADGFDPNRVTRSLLGVGKPYKGFRWEYIRRTPDEIEALKRAFERHCAFLADEAASRTAGVVTIAANGDMIECTIRGPRGDISLGKCGPCTRPRLRRMLRDSVKRWNDPGIDWPSKIEAEVDRFLAPASLDE